MNRKRVRLVAFDLDGTLIHGDTVCEAIARQLGYLDRMRELERLTSWNDIEAVKAAREEMATWYGSATTLELCSYLNSLRLAPGVHEGFRLLKQHEIKIAIVSMTWEFAVEWFARDLGADYYIGTRLLPNGQIIHFWSQDKSRWLADLSQQSGFGLDEVAAVGDSGGDIDMLRIVGYPFFVGKTKPKELDKVSHYPDGDIYEIAKCIIKAPYI